MSRSAHIGGLAVLLAFLAGALAGCRPTVGSWQTITPASIAPGATQVRDVALDAAGNLWLATYGGGLCRRSADGREQRCYRAEEGGLLTDYVGAVSVDGRGRVWAGCDWRSDGKTTLPSGLSVLEPDGTWRSFARPADKYYAPKAFEADQAGRVWFAAGGWRSFDGETWGEYADTRAAVEAWFSQRPARSRLWATEREAVWLLDTAWKAGVDPKTVPPTATWAFQETRLARYDGRNWQFFDAPAGGLSSNLTLDAKGRQWASLIHAGDVVLGAGAAYRSDGAWKRVDKTTGLLDDDVNAITADARGDVWLTHGKGGVSRFTQGRWVTYAGGAEGRGIETLERGVEDKVGRLWFPSRAGVVVYTPSAQAE